MYHETPLLRHNKGLLAVYRTWYRMYVVTYSMRTHKTTGFVEQGGSYLGLCAGAYYACTAIEFEAGTR